MIEGKVTLLLPSEFTLEDVYQAVSFTIFILISFLILNSFMSLNNVLPGITTCSNTSKNRIPLIQMSRFVTLKCVASCSMLSKTLLKRESLSLMMRQFTVSFRAAQTAKIVLQLICSLPETRLREHTLSMEHRKSIDLTTKAAP